MKIVSRTGVYGVAYQKGSILLVTQKNGPHAGKFDLPGGGIEPGETIEQALRREFLEEVHMSFHSMTFLDNFTTTTEIPSLNGSEPYLFHQIGMLYRVIDVHPLEDHAEGTLKSSWVRPRALSSVNASPFVLQAITFKV